MRIEKTGTGKTMEEAVENAKALLAAPEDAEIQFEPIQYAKKKFFGLKTEPAKVTVWYEVPDPAPKAEKPERPAKPEKTGGEKGAKPAQKKEAPKKEAPAKKEQPAVAVAEEPARIPVEIPEHDRTAAYLRMIVAGMGIEQCDISLEKIEESSEFIYNISCGSADGVLIGRRGETLDAIQYLVRLSENKGLDEDKHRKISVNIGDYREKRNDNLRSLAQKNARRVLKYGRNVALEPMSPYERRIIHTAIQNIEGVTSHSVGSDANRKVIITLEEGVKPTNPSKGGYGGRDRGGYNRDRGGRDRGGRGYQKREAYQPAVTREPRKDSEGSLYGKIEIPAKPEE